MIAKEIENTKDLFEDLEIKFKEPQNKNKLKELKKDYEKQCSRFKLVIEDILSKSFIRRSSTN